MSSLYSSTVPRGSSPSQQSNWSRGAHRHETGMRRETAIIAARGQVCSPAHTLQPGSWGPRRDFRLPRGRREPGRKCRGSRPLGKEAPAAASRASLAAAPRSPPPRALPRPLGARPSARPGADHRQDTSRPLRSLRPARSSPRQRAGGGWEAQASTRLPGVLAAGPGRRRKRPPQPWNVSAARANAHASVSRDRSPGPRPECACAGWGPLTDLRPGLV